MAPQPKCIYGDSPTWFLASPRQCMLEAKRYDFSGMNRAEKRLWGQKERRGLNEWKSKYILQADVQSSFGWHIDFCKSLGFAIM